MKKRLLDLLACPSCQGLLAIEPHEIRATDIVEGRLQCQRCIRVYSVRNGIPHFVNSGSDGDGREVHTAKHFAHEFTALSEGNRDVDHPDLVEHYFLTRTGIDLRVFDEAHADALVTELPRDSRFRPDYTLIREKLVLDAGCGPGRFTKVAAQQADLVVGLDIGDHIDRAQKSCDDLDNVEFVQGSVLNPPFRYGIFDFVFAIGVLHHTPDPKRGCHALGKLVVPAGHLSVWVYSPDYWNGFIRGITGRVIHAIVSRLPTKAAWIFCARVLYPLGKIQMMLARNRFTKLIFAPLFIVSVPRHPKREVMITTIYDYYGPRIISTHTYEEVREWFDKGGFGELRSLPLATGVIGKKMQNVPGHKYRRRLHE